jgi:hypothetical protein
LKENTTLNDIAKALFVVNRHAKTAPDPSYLYQLKKQTVAKLLEQNKAKKIGLHFSEHPKLSRQHSTMLVQVAEYYFHIPAAKEDFKTLPHLGELDKTFRNPKPNLSLSQAKRILASYLNLSPQEAKKKQQPPVSRSAYYTPSSLGQFTWPDKKKRRS